MALSVIYEQKRALIIGINKYRRDSLLYCVNDAEDLQTSLQRIGFNVSLGLDCNLNELYDTVDIFLKTIQRNDFVLFYFAGHGKQIDDQNYLLPSDYKYEYRGHEREYIVEHAVNVQYIMQKIDESKCRISIYLFDCCRKLVRDRAENQNKGILPISPPLQTLIVFGCAPGRMVMDETYNNRNGSFVENLLKYITIRNKDIEEIMRKVAYDVNLQTAGYQLPYRTSSLTESVYLGGIDRFRVYFHAYHPEYDRDYRNIEDPGIPLTRAGIEYRRPYGWKRYAIKVIGKYKNDVWLGSNNNPDEWPVAYHGTSHEAAKQIAQSGYDLTKHERFTYGHGIYSTPDINIAKKYSRPFCFRGQLQEYTVVIQNRVNPKTLIKLSAEETGTFEYWMSPSHTDIRPYGLCILETDETEKSEWYDQVCGCRPGDYNYQGDLIGDCNDKLEE